MKIIRNLAVFVLVLLPLVTLAKKKKGPDSDSDVPDNRPTVTMVAPKGVSDGTVTISGDDAPFQVDSSTTIVIDGNPGTMAQIHIGMVVVSHTLPNGSRSEIDLKTPPVTTTKKKKNQTNTGDADSNQ